jgi:glycosyltransferase involved in cell wall biosynthesis
MDLRKKSLGIIQWGSYRGFPVGGISTFVESIIPQLAEAFELKLIGMSMGEPIGQWTTVDISGRTYDFLPVVGATESKLVPDRVRLAWAVAKHRNAILTQGIDAFYVHMTEAAIPLVACGEEPVIVHVHGLYNLFRFSRHWLGPRFAIVYDRLYPQLFSRCAKVIGVGTQLELDEFCRTMRVRSGAVVPTCVRESVFYPQDRAAARRELGIGSDETLLLYVGRMTETKNPLLLLEAGRLLQRDVPGLELVFAGDGPLRAQLEREAASSSGVVVVGTLSSNETALWMNAADALTVVSKAEAFTSIVALEALSCGTPVVATPVSALPDMIREGINGAVSEGFTPEQYAQSVRRVLRTRPSIEACTRTARSYSSAAVGARLVEEIRETLNEIRGDLWETSIG